MDTLSKALRPTLIPNDGNVFVVGDWAQIEARCLPYLSDSPGGRKKLKLFADGVDVYDVVKEQMGLEIRDQGKVADLACGFGGAVKAFQAMARNYGLRVSDAEAQTIVDRWRSTNPWAVQFWSELERAAKQAIARPGKEQKAGLVSYLFLPQLMDGTLLCMMPGDHFLQYPKARIEPVMAPWGEEIYSVTAIKAAYTAKADETEWPRTALYGGLLAENITQAFAAALLRNAVRDMPDVVAHVHDEIVLEVPEGDAKDRAAMLQSTMEKIPPWAVGLPLKAEPEVMYRYGK